MFFNKHFQAWGEAEYSLFHCLNFRPDWPVHGKSLTQVQAVRSVNSIHVVRYRVTEIFPV
jgi:hypothetical protein